MIDKRRLCVGNICIFILIKESTVFTVSINYNSTATLADIGSVTSGKTYFVDLGIWELTSFVLIRILGTLLLVLKAILMLYFLKCW